MNVALENVAARTAQHPIRDGDRIHLGKLARAADTEHSDWHICVRAARPLGRARCGAGAGCSGIKYQSLLSTLLTAPHAQPKSEHPMHAKNEFIEILDFSDLLREPDPRGARPQWAEPVSSLQFCLIKRVCRCAISSLRNDTGERWRLLQGYMPVAHEEPRPPNHREPYLLGYLAHFEKAPPPSATIGP